MNLSRVYFYSAIPHLKTCVHSQQLLKVVVGAFSSSLKRKKQGVPSNKPYMFLPER